MFHVLAEVQHQLEPVSCCTVVLSLLVGPLYAMTRYLIVSNPCSIRLVNMDEASASAMGWFSLAMARLQCTGAKTIGGTCVSLSVTDSSAAVACQLLSFLS